MIVWLTKSGCLLGISPTAMGLTFGAAGTSMPDCLVSLHVARGGEANMAVSSGPPTGLQCTTGAPLCCLE